MVCNDKRFQFFDLKDRNQLKRIESNLTDPNSILTKAIQAIKFQDLQDKKYITHLEKRCTTAEQEREDLRIKCADLEE